MLLFVVVMQVNSNSGSGCVAQLVERSLPIPEVSGSNPVIKFIYIEHLITVNCVLKRQKERKRGREWPIFQKKLVKLETSGTVTLPPTVSDL